MLRLLKNFIALLEWFEKKWRWGFWLYVVLAGLVTFEVIARYFFHTPHDWFLEIAILLSVLSGFWGAAITTWENHHISLDIVYVKLKPRWRRRVDVFNSLVGTIVSAILAFYVIQQAIFLNNIDARYSSVIATPFSYQTLGVAMGLVISAIYFFGRLVKILIQDTPDNQLSR